MRQRNRIESFWVVLWIGLTLISGALGAAQPGPEPQIGTSLGFLVDTAGEWPFVDVFKTSSGWYSSGICGWDCGTLDLDENGWVRSLQPSQMATALIFTQVPGMMPHSHVDQEYHVFYDGIGVVDYDGSVVEVTSQGPGHDVVKVDPASDQAFAITIILTAETWDPDVVVPPGDYIRNVRVVAPGGVCSDDPFAACQSNADCGGSCDLFSTGDNYLTQRFHPTFLNNIRRYGVLRLMDWMNTNENGMVDADEWPEVSDARWNIAPVSVMTDLANRLQKDLWINLPHLASQGLIDGLATGFAALDPLLKLYVEYSSELWNPEYRQYQEVAELACQTYGDLTAACDSQDAGGTDGVLCDGHASSAVAACDEARIRYTSDRAVFAWQRFAAAFDAQTPGSSTDRLVRVMASRSGDHTLHEALLSRQNTYQSVDAFATAAYFGWPLGGDDVVQGWDPAVAADMDALFARLITEVDVTVDDMAWDLSFLATGSGGQYSDIPLVFYEGGQGLVPWGDNADTQAHLDHANLIFDAASRDPRIGGLYQRLLEGWRIEGDFQLFNHYVNCRRFGFNERYGALEHQRQDHATAPKYQALMDYIDFLEQGPIFLDDLESGDLSAWF